jgi:hypothetical protein
MILCQVYHFFLVGLGNLSAFQFPTVWPHKALGGGGGFGVVTFCFTESDIAH